MYNPMKKDDAVSNLSNAACDIKDTVNKAANQAGRDVRGMLHAANDEVVHAGHAVTGEIRSNPVRSAAIALGAGVVLGALLRR